MYARGTTRNFDVRVIKIVGYAVWTRGTGEFGDGTQWIHRRSLASGDRYFL